MDFFSLGTVTGEGKGGVNIILYLRCLPAQSKYTIFQKHFWGIRVTPVALIPHAQVIVEFFSSLWTSQEELTSTGRLVSSNNTRDKSCLFYLAFDDDLFI